MPPDHAPGGDQVGAVVAGHVNSRLHDILKTSTRSLECDAQVRHRLLSLALHVPDAHDRASLVEGAGTGSEDGTKVAGGDRRVRVRDVGCQLRRTHQLDVSIVSHRWRSLHIHVAVEGHASMALATCRGVLDGWTVSPAGRTRKRVDALVKKAQHALRALPGDCP